MKYLLLIFMAAQVVACTASDTTDKGIAEVCVSNSECPGEQICRYDVCTVPTAVSRELGFKLVPSNASNFQPQSVLPAPLDFDSPVSLGLRPSIWVAGQLLFRRRDGSLELNGPSGVLTFRQQGSQYALASTQTRVDDSRYSLLLLPGPYSVTFAPDDPDVPRKGWAEREFMLDTNPDFTIARDALELQGTFIDSIGASERPIPIEGAEIVAISRETSSTSTVASTDSTGVFKIRLLPFSGSYDVRVAYENNGRKSEYIVKSVLECAEQRCTSTSSQGQTLIMNGENLLGETHDVAVALIPLGEAIPNWEGVSISVFAEFPWGQLRITEPATGGDVKLQLPVGDYRVEVAVPDDFPFSSFTAETTVMGEQDRVEFKLESRIPVTGNVVDSQGMPLSDVSIEMTPRDEIARSVSTTTDEDGQFHADLDLTDYWLSVVPNRPGVPRLVEYLPLDKIDGLDKIRLAEPLVLTGAVLGGQTQGDNDGDWERVAEVSVQAFDVIAGKTMVVGEATTRENGEFRMLIPSSADRVTEPEVLP